MSLNNKMYLSDHNLFLTGTISVMSAAFIAIIFISGIDNPHILFLTFIFAGSLILFIYNLNSVTIREDGLEINSKFIPWENIQHLDTTKSLTITTINQEKYKISYNFSSLNLIIEHIKSARSDLFVAPFQFEFNHKLPYRLPVVILCLLTVSGGLLSFLNIPFEYSIGLGLSPLVILLIIDPRKYDTSHVALANGILQVRYLIKRNMCRNFDEITNIEKSQKKDMEYLKISFSDGKSVKIPNLISEGQYLYDNLQRLRSS